MYHKIQNDLKELVEMLGDDIYKLEGKTVLLTGGAGFLGKYYVALFIYLNQNVFKNPAKLIVLDNFITGDESLITGDEGIKFIKHDVNEDFECEEDIDYIIHAAGIASPLYYIKFPLETMDSTIFGLRKMLDFARKKNVNSFAYFSSSEVYGSPDDANVPTKEDYHGNVSFSGPRACYDEGKRIGETICGIYHREFGIPIKMIRPFNIYGPGMRVDDYRVISNFLTKALKSEPITVHGNGEFTRTFCYITDGIAGFMKVLLRGQDGHAYNIGNSNEEISMYDLAHRVKNTIGDHVQVDLVESPHVYSKDNPRRRCPDLTKSREHLNYEPRVSLEEGIRRTTDWYRHIMGL
jgi:UDP-glucuronate decarboxylase